MALLQLLIVIHLLSMAGVFGAVMYLSHDSGPDPSTLTSAQIFLVTLLASGFGLLYVKYAPLIRRGIPIKAIMAIVSAKLLIMLALGALLGVTAAKLKKGNTRAPLRIRPVLLFLTALAVSLGVMLSRMSF